MKWIRIERPLPLPALVREAISRLNETGYVAYVVGGSVRDFLMGRTPKDHDLATDATPDEILALFPEAIPVGKAFGVVRLVGEVGKAQDDVEIATFRKDLDYVDSRHPSGIELAGPVEDSARRDFTINAIYYDSKAVRVLDLENGQADLRAHLIRAIGNPAKRFQEDALRLLRAVRFAVTLGFQIESETWKAVCARARSITRVSPERIRDEFHAILASSRADEGMTLLHDSGMLHHIVPELLALRGVKQSPLYRRENDLWLHLLTSLRVLHGLYPDRARVLSWAVLLREIGKPVAYRKSGGVNFNGYEIESARIARSILDRLRLPRTEVEAVVAMLADQLKFREIFRMRESRLQRWVREPYFEELLALHHVDSVAGDGNLVAYEFALSRWQSVHNGGGEMPRLIDGKDLIGLGFSPGPEFTAILRTVEDLALEDQLKTKEDALEYVVKHFVR